MFKKLFLVLLIASISFSDTPASEEGIFSESASAFFNSAIQMMNNYNVKNNPLSSVNNKYLFEKYNKFKCKNIGVFVPKSCTTLYDVLLSFAIDIRIHHLLQNNTFANHNDAIELVDFSTVGVSDHIQQVINDFCDHREKYIEGYDIYFENDKLLIRPNT